MMKNRTGLLALLVLAIATILMVFFVLPRISSDEPTPADQQAATEPTEKPAEPATDPVAAVMGKMDRLAKAAADSVQGLAALFADGNTPAAEAYAGARAVAQTAVSALASLDVPEGIDQATSSLVATAKAGAEKALSILDSLPDDPAAAAPLIASIDRALQGVEEPTAETPAQQPAGADAAPQVTPAFELLRVEPNGSTVIAGTAAPGAKIEIVSEDEVIATADVGASGDFAAVLDAPLAPGDYALALRATGPDGTAVTSEQVATVSVPQQGGGEVLAMISQPGQASELISVPEAVNTADKLPRVAAEPAATADESAGAQTADAGTAPTETPEAAPAQAPETAPAEAPQAASAETPETAPAGQPAANAAIQVTAVEIEGDRIFVAGTATSGSLVRAFADDAAIGEARTDTGGHFVVDGTVSLSVGSHTIRVDLLDDAGNVQVRASVPFERPEGQQVAAVAQTSDQPGAMVPLDQGAFQKQRDALSKAFAILRSLFEGSEKPTMEAVAAARSGTEIALKSLADFRPGEAVSEEADAAVTRTAEAATAALTTLQALPRDVDAIGKALPKLAELVDAVLAAAPSPAVAPAPAAAGQISETAPAAEPAASETATAEPQVIEQAPLTESKNSVIIRRGDTLWQISRRIYGQGVRYTTIYLANEDQIPNPDLIEPGQIFTVPDEALPNSEELHWRRMHGQKID